MKEQFVTSEIALKLKELSFDSSCFSAYTENGKLMDIGDYSNDDKVGELDGHSYYISCLSPLWQQVTDWFREKHNIHISIYPKMDVNCIDYTAKIYQYSEDSYFGEGDDEEYLPGGLKMIFEERLETYEDAREQVILKCIELLKNK